MLTALVLQLIQCTVVPPTVTTEEKHSDSLSPSPTDGDSVSSASKGKKGDKVGGCAWIGGYFDVCIAAGRCWCPDDKHVQSGLNNKQYFPIKVLEKVRMIWRISCIKMITCNDYRCSGGKDEDDFRPLFENFIQDLLTTLNLPMWPASEVLLTLLGMLLVSSVYTQLTLFCLCYWLPSSNMCALEISNKNTPACYAISWTHEFLFICLPFTTCMLPPTFRLCSGN